MKTFYTISIVETSHQLFYSSAFMHVCMYVCIIIFQRRVTYEHTVLPKSTKNYYQQTTLPCRTTTANGLCSARRSAAPSQLPDFRATWFRCLLTRQQSIFRNICTSSHLLLLLSQHLPIVLTYIFLRKSNNVRRYFVALLPPFSI